MARVAVVGAGMAGATCARWLADAGCSVQVFDKSRGVGGRMSTRRTSWIEPGGDSGGGAGGTDQGPASPARFDHGSPGFSARSAEFSAFAEQAARDGLLQTWTPRIAPAGHAPLGDHRLWMPLPDMPALCRALLAGVRVVPECRIDTLAREAGGWRLHSDGAVVAEGLDAVVVALPLPQAAPLLQPHAAPWAERAMAVPMLPAWVLMAITDEQPALDAPGSRGDIAWPRSGPLALVLRNDAVPGRVPIPGRAQWVLHATAAWSRTHLEAEAHEAVAALQQALAGWLARRPQWHHAVVHRWRFASAARAAEVPGACWWDQGLRLGVCGDALGGAGVEGAWRSGRALAAAALASLSR